MALRLLQEGLTNSLRHAWASRIDVRLRFLPQGRIAVLVVDDGIGFDKSRILDGQPSELNVGLYGMIERTELAGGRLHIRTRPGPGCRHSGCAVADTHQSRHIDEQPPSQRNPSGSCSRTITISFVRASRRC